MNRVNAQERVKGCPSTRTNFGAPGGIWVLLHLATTFLYACHRLAMGFVDSVAQAAG
jgi:hypothetical protein